MYKVSLNLFHSTIHRISLVSLKFYKCVCVCVCVCVRACVRVLMTENHFTLALLWSRAPSTVMPAKSDSNFMICLQSYQGLIIDRSLVY